MISDYTVFSSSKEQKPNSEHLLNLLLDHPTETLSIIQLLWVLGFLKNFQLLLSIKCLFPFPYRKKNKSLGFLYLYLERKTFLAYPGNSLTRACQNDDDLTLEQYRYSGYLLLVSSFRHIKTIHPFLNTCQIYMGPALLLCKMRLHY